MHMNAHTCTHTQIYNEVIYDLLALAQPPPGGAAPGARQPLKLKEAKGGHINVQGAAEVGCAAYWIWLFATVECAKHLST